MPPVPARTLTGAERTERSGDPLGVADHDGGQRGRRPCTGGRPPGPARRSPRRAPAGARPASPAAARRRPARTACWPARRGWRSTAPCCPGRSGARASSSASVTGSRAIRPSSYQVSSSAGPVTSVATSASTRKDEPAGLVVHGAARAVGVAAPLPDVLDQAGGEVPAEDHVGQPHGREVRVGAARGADRPAGCWTAPPPAGRRPRCRRRCRSGAGGASTACPVPAQPPARRPTASAAAAGSRSPTRTSVLPGGQHPGSVQLAQRGAVDPGDQVGVGQRDRRTGGRRSAARPARCGR